MKYSSEISRTMMVCFISLFFFSLSACSQKPTDGSLEMSPTASSDSMMGKNGMENQASEQINPVLYELMMNDLMKSPANWNRLDEKLKLKAVDGFLNLLKNRERAKITKPAAFYVTRVDSMLAQSPTMPQNLPTILKIVSVMEYDFDTGKDKEVLAKEILGPKLYEANRARRAMSSMAQNQPK